MRTPSTIFALASAQGRAGVAIFRVSGPQAWQVFETLCRPSGLPAARKAQLRAICRADDGEAIDRGLTLWFPSPDSFTGEDVAEIHVHGGRAIVQAVAASLHGLPGFRLAEPGEFTRRAFENGKLDLTEAEAIADLVNAETEAQRRQAYRQYEGVLGALYETWRERLMRVLAHLEASIDFADDDVPPDLDARQTQEIEALAVEMAAHLNDRHRGERLRDGISVAILGPPNAGKSSILNVLARRDAAIVSATAGTTRDVIDVHLDLGGYPVTLADTAGLRESADALENEGMRRALARAAQADMKLLVFDGAAWPGMDPATRALADAATLAVVNKSDLIERAMREKGADGNGGAAGAINGVAPLFVSATTGEGIPALLEGLTRLVDGRCGWTDAPVLTTARHREAVETCVNHLNRAAVARQTELQAEDVRMAARSLGRITGRVDVEDVLDIIFRDFCIGK